MSIDALEIARILTTIVAFLIFFWLARKMFWKPMMDMIEERQLKIRGEFDKIDNMQRQVDQLQADYGKRLADIEAEARVKIQEAMAQGKQMADQIAEQARRDAEASRIKSEQTLALGIDKARAELKADVARMTLAATEKLIRHNMDDARQRDLVDSFVEELSSK